jgi:hypothetical protein
VQDSEIPGDHQSGSRRNLGPSQSKKAGIVTSRPSPFGAGCSKKIRSRGLQEFGTYWLLLSLEFIAGPPALVVWRGRLWPAAAGSSRSAPVIAVRCVRAARRLRDHQDPLGRHDPPCTLRRAVSAVTGVIAVSAMIAGIVLPGPVRAARTVAIHDWGRASRDCRDRRADLP